jgi:hypothetical protein
VRRVMFRRVYGYPLAEGYVVFWRVIRRNQPFITLHPTPPVRIEILAIERP